MKVRFYMNELKIFENSEFGKVRTLEIDGKPYFVASDVATALGYANPRKAVLDHCKGVTKRDTPTSSGIQSMSYIGEGDLYRLIMKSKLPNAEKFESWVMDDVLPSIRKHGMYATEELLANPDLLISVAQELKAEREKSKRLKQKIEQDKPKTIFADAVATSSTSILIGDLAKIIKQNGVDIGQKRLFSWLRENGYLIKRKGADWNSPTQKSMEMELFEVKETAITHSDGHVSVSKTTKVTGKGQQFFINKFLQNMEAIA